MSDKHIHDHLVRIENKLDWVIEALCEMMASGQDMARLAAKSAELKGKTDALKAAVASVDTQSPKGAK